MIEGIVVSITTMSRVYTFFCSLHAVLLETRIKPTFNGLIPTIFSLPLKITSAKIQI